MNEWIPAIAVLLIGAAITALEAGERWWIKRKKLRQFEERFMREIRDGKRADPFLDPAAIIPHKYLKGLVPAKYLKESE